MFVCCCKDAAKETEVDLNKSIIQSAVLGEADENEDTQMPEKVEAEEKPTELPARTFEVELDVSGHNDSGITLDISSGEFPVVRQTEGAAKAWNNVCPAGMEIKRCDRLLRVDGQEVACALVVPNLATFAKQHLKLTFKRPIETEVVLKKPGKLGMTINYKKETVGVWIAEISDGLLAAWNEANPDSVVSKQDRIIGVNGFRGEPSAIIEKMRAGGDSSDLVLSILRYA
eukprot:TRINITY_DN4778_c0_g1_i1.p1 TRINITY_DN4778_c0_g1~~TRINITY_DN4778_c0_g1_i1.p1  ORF type:complete len:229 (-),score=53.22 TRINITY_DN4778_c0_g1_i1:84-770(-)